MEDRTSLAGDKTIQVTLQEFLGAYHCCSQKKAQSIAVSNVHVGAVWN
jgi:hypothetical protein